MPYKVKTPWWLSRIVYSKLNWRIAPAGQPCVYLTFDDGPHEKATPFVLEELAKYDAKATFFCIGKNVAAHPDIYNKILQQGHAAGNHTYNHLNGWHTKTEEYLKDIRLAGEQINSHLFRPPYGRIKRSQINRLLNSNEGWKIIMWDVLSGDFDKGLSPEKCLENVLNNIEPGSIVVFHDSKKAWERMSYALPHVLEYCKQKNWQLKSLTDK